MMMQVLPSPAPLPCLLRSLLISAEEPMKGAIERAKWHLPSIGTRLFWNQHQANSSVILGSITNISSEIEVEALERSMRQITEQLLKRLGVSGRITIEEVEGRVPFTFLVFRIQLGTEKKTN